MKLVAENAFLFVKQHFYNQKAFFDYKSEIRDHQNGEMSIFMDRFKLEFKALQWSKKITLLR